MIRLLLILDWAEPPHLQSSYSTNDHRPLLTYQRSTHLCLWQFDLEGSQAIFAWERDALTQPLPASLVSFWPLLIRECEHIFLSVRKRNVLAPCIKIDHAFSTTLNICTYNVMLYDVFRQLGCCLPQKTGSSWGTGNCLCSKALPLSPTACVGMRRRLEGSKPAAHQIPRLGRKSLPLSSRSSLYIP